MKLTRTHARLIRHATALAVSVALMGGVVAASSHLGAGVSRSFRFINGEGPSRPLPWPWLVFGMPGLFSFPLSLVFEWLERRRQVRAWVVPLLLVPLVAMVWAFVQGLDGSFEGAVSVMGGLPAGVFCAAAFTTYWLPLWLVRRWLRRFRSARGQDASPEQPSPPVRGAGEGRSRRRSRTRSRLRRKVSGVFQRYLAD